MAASSVARQKQKMAAQAEDERANEDGHVARKLGWMHPRGHHAQSEFPAVLQSVDMARLDAGQAGLCPCLCPPLDSPYPGASAPGGPHLLPWALGYGPGPLDRRLSSAGLPVLGRPWPAQPVAATP
jgi:hypothetical protein